MLNHEIAPTRLEAFSDGVIAIIITIMVLELKVPHTESLEGLVELWPVFISYALSFLLVAEYWMNHQLLFHMIKRIDNRILWSNMLLLFCTSLIPFFTAYMGENHISQFSVALYSACSLVCALAFLNIVHAVTRHFKEDQSLLSDRRSAVCKNHLALVFYSLAIGAAFIHPALSLALNFVPAVMYFLPDAWLQKKEK